MALHYVGLMSFPLDIFEGHLVGIFTAGNWKVKMWGYQMVQKAYKFSETSRSVSKCIRKQKTKQYTKTPPFATK